MLLASLLAPGMGDAARDAAPDAVAAGTGMRVVFGSDDNYPPFEFLDEDGHPAGFNVDLIRAIGRTMGWQLTVRLGHWAQIRHELEVEGSVDVSDMFRTPSRERIVDFADPFTVAFHEIFVRRGEPPIHSVEALRGKRVIVQEAAIVQEMLQDMDLGASLVPVASEPAALALLAAGHHDAAVVSQTLARSLLGQPEFADLVSTGAPVLPADYAFVVAKGRPELLAQLNAGLRAVRSSGEFDELHEKWFDAAALSRRNLVRYAAWVGVPLLLLAALAAGWLLSLRATVARRTRQLSAELESRRRAEEKLQRAVAAGGVGLWDWDLRTGTVNYSPEWKRQLGYQEDEISDSLEEWSSRLHPDDQCQLATAQQAALDLSGQETTSRFRLRHKDGSYRHILSRGRTLLDGDGRPRRMIGAHVDITDFMQLQAELQEAQNLASLGQLSGGIAHEFNNALTVILGNAEVALTDTSRKDPSHANLTAIRESAEHVAAVTRQLLAFGRKQLIVPVVFDVAGMIQDMRAPLQEILGDDIQLAIDSGTTPARIKADAAQIRQAIVNLATNARDAMPDGGAWTVAIQVLQLDAAVAAGRDLPEGRYVALSATDTGVGMDAATLARAFEPFFTTKPHGRGTGLGLSTVHGIVRQSGGSVTARSRPGEGTTIEICLPCMEELAPPSHPPMQPPATDCGETILVVEDDPDLRMLAKQVLQSAGYIVLTAGDAEQALRVSAGHDGPIHLLFVDVTLPGMSGPDLARQLAALRPDMKVLHTSGYTEQAAVREGVADQKLHFIGKPWSIEALRKTVRALLEA